MSGKSDAKKFLADEVLDPSDPHVRESEAFPSLSADQVERVSSFGVVQRLPRGTVLYEPGCRTADFFVVLDGLIEAYVSRGTTQQVVHEYGEQQFTGELNLFNDRATLVGGRMGCDGRVARLNGAQFRRLLAAEPDIANVVMRAFILRRERIILLGHTAVTIIAPRDSAKSLQLKRFLDRNRQPYLVADPEVESEAATQLSALGFVTMTHRWCCAVTIASWCARHRGSSATASVSPRRLTHSTSPTWSWSEPGRPDWPRRCIRPPKASTRSFWRPMHLAVRPRQAHASRTIWGSR